MMIRYDMTESVVISSCASVVLVYCLDFFRKLLNISDTSPPCHSRDSFQNMVILHKHPVIENYFRQIQVLHLICSSIAFDYLI